MDVWREPEARFMLKLKLSPASLNWCTAIETWSGWEAFWCTAQRYTVMQRGTVEEGGGGGRGTLHFSLILWHTPELYTYTHTVGLWTRAEPNTSSPTCTLGREQSIGAFVKSTPMRDHAIPRNDLRVLQWGVGSLLCHRWDANPRSHRT